MLWKLSLEANPPEKMRRAGDDEDEDGQAALLLGEGGQALAAAGPHRALVRRVVGFRRRRLGQDRLARRGFGVGHRVPLPRAT